ncbi:UNKNOWN [Stylonychia lemnae]|uniref:Uncharacterized protein n=1 Tax=Stylonychia lemnae TaxID=5949 RepID=A0A077ZZE4_STYLE|nr:UNKNOWN [Stylonychia lemnae]|eukprot:CDW74962.1 UNKNOWN [Stylonychia lemnae]
MSKKEQKKQQNRKFGENRTSSSQHPQIIQGRQVPSGQTKQQNGQFINDKIQRNQKDHQNQNEEVNFDHPESSEESEQLEIQQKVLKEHSFTNNIEDQYGQIKDDGNQASKIPYKNENFQ